MLNIDATDLDRFDEKIAAMKQRLETFPTQVAGAVDRWQVAELHRGSAAHEVIGGGQVRSIVTRKRGRGQHRYAKIIRRYSRRLLRRALPKPIRQFQRHVRIGRRPERVLLPLPIRRARGFAKKFAKVAGGQQRAVRGALGVTRALRPIRQARLNVELWEALVASVEQTARDNLQWK